MGTAKMKLGKNYTVIGTPGKNTWYIHIDIILYKKLIKIINIFIYIFKFIKN